MKYPIFPPGALGGGKAFLELPRTLKNLGESPLLAHELLAHDSFAKALVQPPSKSLTLEIFEKASAISGGVALSARDLLSSAIVEPSKAVLTIENLTRTISTIGISQKMLEPSPMAMAAKTFEATTMMSPLDNIGRALKASAGIKTGTLGIAHVELWSGIEMPSGIVPSNLYVSKYDLRRILDTGFERSAVDALTNEIVGSIHALSRDFDRDSYITRRGRRPNKPSKSQRDARDVNEYDADSTDAKNSGSSGRILLVNGDYSTVEPHRHQYGFIGSVPIFIGNADCNQEEREELSMHLTSLRVRELIRVLGDTDMHLARVGVLLISAAYLDHLYRTKTHKTMESMARRGVALLPVFLSDVVVDGTFIAQLKSVPSNGRPISRWKSRDSAFVDVVKSLERVIHEIIAQANMFSLKH